MLIGVSICRILSGPDVIIDSRGRRSEILAGDIGPTVILICIRALRMQRL
jgi:hypothetical protein